MLQGADTDGGPHAQATMIHTATGDLTRDLQVLAARIDSMPPVEGSCVGLTELRLAIVRRPEFGL